MESPEYSIKSNLSFESPFSLRGTNRPRKRSCFKMVIDLVQDSPMSIEASNWPIDRNSCGFSDQSEDDEDSSQATNLDESFSFKSIENDMSICLYEELEVTNECTKSCVSSMMTITSQVGQNLDEPSEKLVGDMSRLHTLPILSKCRHSDLASIDSFTLADLLNGVYDEKISKCVVLDARYPYEYNGGHINGAKSAYEKKDIMDNLFKEALSLSPSSKPVIIVFHCEFSAERGPKLMREFRERDRTLNKYNYPNLFYPEIYLLEGGYKIFYQNHDKLCEPRSYLPMLHDQHRNEMKYFRKKSKSWEIETRKSKFVTKTKLNFF